VIRSLLGSSATITRLQADFLVVGGGIAGLLVATRLARTRRHVVVIESGGERQETESHPLNEVVYHRSTYRGATKGRFRCLGGTSTRWGGAMIPFLGADIAGGRWPIEHGELVKYLPEVEQLFALPAGPYDWPELIGSEEVSRSHIARLAKWPHFGKRNVASLLKAELRSHRGPEIWLHATAVRFVFAPDGSLENVEAEAPDGCRLVITARETVIAAGAIESTRLLLLADRQHGNRLFAPTGVLGRYFYDHLSAMVGRVKPDDRAALNRVAGFRFVRGGMRNLRFELAEATPLRDQVPPGFAHISFTSRDGSGIDGLRNLYRQIQKRRLPDFPTVAVLAKNSPFIARAVWWRFAEHRLLYPFDASIELHVVIEQLPVSHNRIVLSPDRVDVFGEPLAVIDWGVSSADEKALLRWTNLFYKFWTESQLSRLAKVLLRPSSETLSDLTAGGDVFHPGGSLRMGNRPSDGVVDHNLQVFHIPNLSVVSTAVFPTGGGANPTMMLMMAALRTADRLANSVAGAG